MKRTITYLVLGLTLTLVSCAGSSEEDVHSGPGGEPVEVISEPVTLPRRVPNDRFMLLSSDVNTLLIQVTPTATQLFVVDGDPGKDSSPALPVGFTPASALSIDHEYFLLGSTCTMEGSCSPTLLNSDSALIKWRSIPTDGQLAGDDGLGYLGLTGGELFVSPGVGQRPAMVVLGEDKQSWHQVKQPAETNGASTSICSTRGQVYAFTSMPLAAQFSTDEITEPDGSPKPGVYNVWALREDGTWAYSRTDIRPTKADPRDPPESQLCSGGRVFLRPVTESKSTLELGIAAGGDLTTSLVNLPPMPEGQTNLGYPPAVAVGATGQIFGDGVLLDPAGVKVPNDVTTIASTETATGFALVVETSTGESSLWKVAS